MSVAVTEKDFEPKPEVSIGESVRDGADAASGAGPVRLVGAGVVGDDDLVAGVAGVVLRRRDRRRRVGGVGDRVGDGRGGLVGRGRVVRGRHLEGVLAEGRGVDRRSVRDVADAGRDALAALLVGAGVVGVDDLVSRVATDVGWRVDVDRRSLRVRRRVDRGDRHRGVGAAGRARAAHVGRARVGVARAAAAAAGEVDRTVPAAAAAASSAVVTATAATAADAETRSASAPLPERTGVAPERVAQGYAPGASGGTGPGHRVGDAREGGALAGVEAAVGSTGSAAPAGDDQEAAARGAHVRAAATAPAGGAAAVGESADAATVEARGPAGPAVAVAAVAGDRDVQDLSGADRELAGEDRPPAAAGDGAAPVAADRLDRDARDSRPDQVGVVAGRSKVGAAVGRGRPRQSENRKRSDAGDPGAQPAQASM